MWTATSSECGRVQRFLRVMAVERAWRIVEEINAALPDVILLPGDFIADRDYSPDSAATAEDEIAQGLGLLSTE